MGRINNLDEDPMAEVMRRLKALERAAPVGFTEISRGALIVSSLEGLIVRGSASVTGTLKGIGKFLWNGAVELTSTLLVTAEAKFQGATTIQNTLDVTAETVMRGATNIKNTLDVEAATRLRGETTLEKNMTLTGVGAKITVGSMEISTQAGGYGQLSSPTNIYLNAPFVMAAGVVTTIGNVNVGGELAVNSKVFLRGLPTKSGVTANVYLDPDTDELSIA